MCVATFLEAHDLTGKTVIPFTTHEGSGFGSGLSDLKKALLTATVTKGLSIQGSKVGPDGKRCIQPVGRIHQADALLCAEVRTDRLMERHQLVACSLGNLPRYGKAVA